MQLHRFAIGLLLCVGASLSLSAQQFVLSSADRARLLALDFVVTDGQGQPVRDLRPDEVSLKIDGRTRAIRSLEFVPVTGAITDEGPAITSVPPPYGTNTAADAGRTVVLIIDRETIRPGGEAAMKAQINRFLRGLGPQDRVALLTAPYGGLKVDLTTDMSRISVALAAITGHASAAESSADAACRTGALLVALRGTLDDLRGGEGPVTVVLFTGQMSVPAGVVNLRSQPDIGRCAVRQEYYSLLSGAAAAARAQFFIIQPDLRVDEGSRAGLEHLSGITGGPLMYLGGDDAAMARVMRETSGYYIARVEPEPSEATGSLRGLSVSVTRPDTTVRHRPQLSVVRPAAPRAGATAITPLEMLKHAQAFRDLPLRVAAFTSREPGSTRVRVVTMFDSPDQAAALSSAMVAFFDRQGRLIMRTELSWADLTTLPAFAALSVPAGTYRVRVAATEAGGRAGAADYHVTAALASAGPLTLSALLLGTERAGTFVPHMDFRDEASVRAQLEIYGGSEGTAVGAAFEIARTANGPALLTVPGVFDATSDPDRFTLTAALAIGALPAGDYVVRATVAAKDQPAGRVLTTLRKVAR